MKISLQKITSSVIICILLLSPVFSFVTTINAAVTVGNTGGTDSTTYIPPNDNAIPVQAGSNILLGNGDGAQNVGIGTNPYDKNQAANLNPDYVNSQIKKTITTATTTTGSTQTSAAGSALGNTAGCGAGQLLSSYITSQITSNFSTAAKTAVQNQAANTSAAITNVPVIINGSVANNINIQTQNNQAQTSAHTGTIGVLGLTTPSWDSISYCIVNAMIIYIADSTIQWINTGFQGNPAFLNNPADFFKQLADEEAGAFVQNLAYGVTGTNVCDVFRSAMVSSILNQYAQQNGYGAGYQNGGYGGSRGLSNGFLGCPFDQNPAMLNSFVQGNFIQGGGWNSWYQVSQNQQSNPYDTYFNTNDRMNSQILTAQANQNRELGWNSGFLSYKKCTDPKDPKTCTVTTPGSVIQDQLNTNLNLGKNRLVLADKFDQVVTALVNQLISTALGKTLQGQQ